jgi:hypothetical protein
MQGHFTTDAATPVAASVKGSPVLNARVEVRTGTVYVHYAGWWGKFWDEGDMTIPLAGASGSAAGCVLKPVTEFLDPTPSSDPDYPQVPNTPKRRLQLDCSKMVLTATPIPFPYTDGFRMYSGVLKLKLTGRAMVAEGEWYNAKPAPGSISK